MAKQYGLIVPGKEKSNNSAPPTLLRKNVFGSDSEDEEDTTKSKSALNCATTLKRQVRLAQQKALEEDPTVYQYDEIYDDMEAKKVDEKKTQEKKERKPRYIGKLLETATKRKQEQERRVERQVQKEREAEGAEFADKESFVTTSYRKKLEELKKLEEQEKREDYLEAIGDVTKQQDLGGFYRHLYSQKLGDDKNAPKTDQESSNVTETVTEETIKDDSHPKQNRKRHYRKRSLSREKDENDTEELNVDNKQHLQSNLDADSDFSIDSSDSETEENVKTEPQETGVEVKIENEVETQKEDDVEQKTKAPQWNDGFKIPEKVKDQGPKPDVPIKKPKIDIWKKRTVGDALADALQRYYERKAMRQIVF